MSEPMRCLICGSSEWDALGYKCGQCGAAMGLRTERCYISDETQKKLLAHADDLASFGITMECVRPMQKSVGGAAEVLALVIAVADSLRSDSGTLRRLVLFLCDLSVPKEEILKLRLDEPKKILSYCRMDKKEDDANRPNP